MSVSALMAMCLSMQDGSTECQVSTRYSKFATSIENCTAEADAMIKKILLDSGKRGWARGICFQQEKYDVVVKRAVEYLQMRGYGVEVKER